MVEESWNRTGIYDWSVYMKVCYILNISLLVIVLWTLICMVVYGTKTGRWRKKQTSSSLNNGAIYVTSVLATVLFVIKQLSTLLFTLLPDSDSLCELLIDIDTVLSALAASSAYFFLWLRQRLVRKHPCLKANISKSLDGLSYLYVSLLAIFTVGLCCLYAIPKSYSYSNEVGFCIHNNSGRSSLLEKLHFIEGYGADILLASTLFLAQLFILVLTIYPAVAKKIDPAASLEDMSQTPRQPGQRVRRKSICKISSPIRSTVRRLIFSSVIIVFVGLTVLIVAAVAVPAGAPVGLRQTVFEFSGFVNVFCMLMNFNFADKVLLLFCRMFTRNS